MLFCCETHRLPEDLDGATLLDLPFRSNADCSMKWTVSSSRLAASDGGSGDRLS
jgi:hypothetical protein